MRPLAYVGKHLYWLGYRMQPIKVRRGISLLTAIGLEWTKTNEEIFDRSMSGESLSLEIDFTTKATALTSAQRGEL